MWLRYKPVRIADIWGEADQKHKVPFPWPCYFLFVTFGTNLFKAYKYIMIESNSESGIFKLSCRISIRPQLQYKHFNVRFYKALNLLRP